MISCIEIYAGKNCYDSKNDSSKSGNGRTFGSGEFSNLDPAKSFICDFSGAEAAGDVRWGFVNTAEVLVEDGADFTFLIFSFLIFIGEGEQSVELLAEPVGGIVRRAFNAVNSVAIC